MKCVGDVAGGATTDVIGVTGLDTRNVHEAINLFTQSQRE